MHYPTLRWLRQQGLLVGVVSDCTHELPELWPSLPVARFVDGAVFSVLIGHRKPHLSLYQSVCRQLGIAPFEAIYVGDGGSNELTGAVAAGIPAIRLVSKDARDSAGVRRRTGLDGSGHPQPHGPHTR